MNTIFIVMEKSSNRTRVSKVFENHADARIECIGSGDFCDFDRSAEGHHQYWIEEWEVVG